MESVVRTSLVDNNGFVPEAILVEGTHSLHVLNYNSPRATGAPAFSAYVVKMLQENGYSDGLVLKGRVHESLWNFEDAIQAF